MRYLTPYRIAAYVLVIFCAGHTAGGMLAQPSHGPEADAVFASMKLVHFNFHGADCTWYGFWFGFGLMLSAFLLFSALVAWQLDKIGPAQWTAAAPIAWGLVVSHVVIAVLSWRYFFVGPGVLATAVAVLLGVGSLLNQARAAKSGAAA